MPCACGPDLGGEMSQWWLGPVKERGSTMLRLAAHQQRQQKRSGFDFGQGAASSRIRPLLCNRGDTAIINIGLSVIFMPEWCRGGEEAQLI
jgi:hypothetical protein